MVICLERGADLHTAQLMPLPLTVSCFSKIQIGFTFLVPAQISSPGKGPLNGYVLVNLLFSVCFATGYIHLGEIKILNSYTGDGVINVLFFTLHPPDFHSRFQFRLAQTTRSISVDWARTSCRR